MVTMRILYTLGIMIVSATIAMASCVVKGNTVESVCTAHVEDTVGGRHDAALANAISSGDVATPTYCVEGRLDMSSPAASQSETVTWTHFPNDVAELREAQRQIGNTLGGAVALQLMAFEIYRHDRREGEEAIRLVNYKSNVQSVLSVISQRYSRSEHSPEEDLYVQPYIVASFLKGATTANRYTPDEPYSITVYWDASRQVEEASPYVGGGHLCRVHVMNANYGTPQRSVQVIKTTPEACFLIQNSPSLYTQCPPISGRWTYVMK
jgi:D-methionine transport system substrate-binding protein